MSILWPQVVSILLLCAPGLVMLVGSVLGLERRLVTSRHLGGVDARADRLWMRRILAFVGALITVPPLFVFELVVQVLARERYFEFCGYDGPGFISPSACASPPELLPVQSLSLLALVVGVSLLSWAWLKLGRIRGEVSVNLHRVRIGDVEVALSDLVRVEAVRQGVWVWRRQDLVLEKRDGSVVRVAMDGFRHADVEQLVGEIETLRTGAGEAGTPDELPEALERLRAARASQGTAG